MTIGNFINVDATDADYHLIMEEKHFKRLDEIRRALDHLAEDTDRNFMIIHTHPEQDYKLKFFLDRKNNVTSFEVYENHRKWAFTLHNPKEATHREN